MLRNETYTGTLWQHRWRKVVKNGKSRFEARPRDEWIAAQVPVIIPKEIFDQIQKRLEENGRHASRNTRREYLLSGLVKHACGSRMGGRYNKGTVYYRCYMSHPHKAPINEVGEPQTCGGTWINGRKLEEAVWDTTTNLMRHPEILMKEMERLSGPDSTTREALEEELAVVLKRLKELPEEERRLVQGYRKGLYPDFMMREEMERVSQEKDENQRRRDALKVQIDRLDRAKAYKGHVQAFAKRVSKGLDNMDFNQRRELLRLLVDEVVYDEGNVTIKTIIPLDEVQLHPEAQGLAGC
jgi:site-specific DNA recombinase